MKHIIDIDELLDGLKRVKSSYGDVFFAHQYAVGINDAISKIKDIVENSPQVPEGYALVPIEPTDAMREAGAARLMHYEGDAEWPNSFTPLQRAAARQDAERVWREMIVTMLSAKHK